MLKTHLLSLGVQTIISFLTDTFKGLPAAIFARDRPLKALTGATGALVRVQEIMLSGFDNDCGRENQEQWV